MGLPKNPIRRRLYQSSTSLASGLSSILLSIYQATLEYEIEGDDHLRLLQAQRKNYIIAVWHTFVDAAIFCLHSRGVCIYSDHPRTKQYENSWTHYFREIGLKTIRGMGYEVLDASLGKQSQGIINFIKIIKDGTPALVAPDGPHGPIYEAKPGVIYMARKSGSVVVPVGMGFSRRVIGPNWADFAIHNLIADGIYRIDVDFKELDFMSSAGLGVFMGAIQKVREKRGDIKLARPNPGIRRLIDVLGFTHLYQIFDSVEAAIGAFN